MEVSHVFLYIIVLVDVQVCYDRDMTEARKELKKHILEFSWKAYIRCPIIYWYH